jgi:hypothetical protein
MLTVTDYNEAITIYDAMQTSGMSPRTQRETMVNQLIAKGWNERLAVETTMRFY